MATSSRFLRRFAVLFSLAVAIGVSPSPLKLVGHSGEAQAQNVFVGGTSARRDRIFRQDRIRRSGVIFRNRSFDRRGVIYRGPAERRLGLRQRGSVNTNVRRAGVRQRGVFVGGNRDRFFNRRDLLYVERRRDIRQRNREIARANRDRGFNRGPVIITPDFGIDPGYIILDDDTLVINSQVRVTKPCPANHNCGYRLYTDGTGPRIISPGATSGYEYDGISGPKVITLEDIN